MQKLTLVVLTVTAWFALSLLGCGGGGGSAGVLVVFLAPVGSPVNYTQGAGVTLQVTAAGGTSGINRVVFTANGVPLGTDTASPYTLVWNTDGYAVGSYSVVATAYDNSSPEQSGTATVTINLQSSGVVVAFTSPTEANRTVTAGTVVPLIVSVTPAGVQRVEFTANGSPINTDLVAPWSYSWQTTGLAPGSYTIVAKAYDNSAPPVTGSASIVIQVTTSTSLDPTVQITSPHTGTQVTGTVTIAFLAQAQAPGAAITQVQVTMGNQTKTVAGSAQTLNSSVNFDTTGMTDGSKQVTALAQDSTARTGSASLNLTVANGDGPPPPPW
jgi:chitinase